MSYQRGEHDWDETVDYTFSIHQLEEISQLHFKNDAYYDETMKLVKKELGLSKAEELNHLKGYGIFFNKSTQRFFAKESSYFMKTRLKLYLSESYLLLTISILIVLLCLVLMNKYLAYQKKYQLAQRIYSEIVIELTKIKKACVKELYIKVVQKYGEEVVELWHLVEKLRVKYECVLVFKDEYKGSYEVFWKV